MEVHRHWSEITTADWLAALLDWEEQERGRRSLGRRLQDARIGRFKPLCDFDWTGPKRCDRAAIEAGAVERLDLALLINRQHHRVHRRIHVEPDNVLDLLGKIRVVGALESAQPVWL